MFGNYPKLSTIKSYSIGEKRPINGKILILYAKSDFLQVKIFPVNMMKIKKDF